MPRSAPRASRLTFFGTARRAISQAFHSFAVDVYPSLVLILTISIWGIDEKLGSLRALRLLLWLGTIGLAAGTVGIGFFACFGLDTAISREFDPAVVARLAEFWNALSGSLHGLLGR